MTQEIIVFIILTAVIGYIIISYVIKLRTKKTNTCGGCTGCDLKQDITCNIPKRD